MGKAAGLGLQFRNSFVADVQTPTAPITDSFMKFGWGIAHYFSKRFFRPIGTDPEHGTSHHILASGFSHLADCMLRAGVKERRSFSMKQGKIASETAAKEPGPVQLALVSTPIVFVAYALALGIGHGGPLRDAIPGGIANTIPTIMFGLAAYALIRGWLIRRAFPVQVAGHVLFCAAYALLSYWLLIVLLGAVNAYSVVQFNVAPFPVRASVWQMLENATVYGIIAALAYRATGHSEVRLVLADGEEETRPGLSRYFIRSGDEIQPIDVHSIVSIAGADDYAEVATLDGKHLVRMTLAEFEKSLDPARFIRIHRSRIVNVEHIDRAEPAGGGRLLLHMQDGEMISASRAGSRLLRDRVL
jgi:two-component system, LytTR family, response regulator